MPFKQSSKNLRQAAAMRLACLPLHCREAGVKRAEKALEDLTDAASQLNVGDLLTEPIVALWNALHRGGESRIVQHHDAGRRKAGSRSDAGSRPSATVQCGTHRVP